MAKGLYGPYGWCSTHASEEKWGYCSRPCTHVLDEFSPNMTIGKFKLGSHCKQVHSTVVDNHKNSVTIQYYL